MFHELRSTYAYIRRNTTNKALTMQRLDTRMALVLESALHRLETREGEDMATRLQNRRDGTSLWWMELDHDTTVAVATYTRFKTKAYGLLHDNGSLMHDNHGPITAADWATACRLAQMNSTNWLLLYHEQRIVRVVFTEHGAYVEGETIMQPDATALPTLQSMTVDYTKAEEPDHEAGNETLASQPALKGAQQPTRRRSNRRR